MIILTPQSAANEKGGATYFSASGQASIKTSLKNPLADDENPFKREEFLPFLKSARQSRLTGQQTVENAIMGPFHCKML